MKKIITILGIFLISGIVFAVHIGGSIKAQNVQLGKLSLQFLDAENHSYKTTSNFLGEYELELPAGYYRVFLEDEHYKLLDSHKKIYSFIKDETLNLQAEEKQKRLEGMVVDEEGYPIEGAKLIVKSSKGEEKMESDRYGKFSIEARSDLLTILASKEGFLDGGQLVLVKPKSSMKNIQIVLKKQYSYIRGIVTDGTKALPGVTVRLRDENLEILDEVFSDSLGYYEFRKVANNRIVVIGVYAASFEEYLSDFIFVDRNYDREHIILRKS